MKRAAIILASLVLTGCGGLLPDGPVDLAATQSTQTIFLDCLHRAARTSDDPRWGVAEAATRIMGACASEWRDSIAAQSSNMMFPARAMYADQMDQQERNIAIDVVLAERKAKGG